MFTLLESIPLYQLNLSTEVYFFMMKDDVVTSHPPSVSGIGVEGMVKET